MLSATAPVDLIKRAISVTSHDPVTGHELDEDDWSRLIELAKAQGVLALVARALKAGGWQGVPSDVVERLTAYRSALTARNLFLTRRLIQILDLLQRRGITALPYKGPLVAAYAYGDIGARPFTDLDLILSDTDVLVARRLLLAEGYRSLAPRSDSDRSGGLPHGHALGLQSHDGRAVVELHWRVTASSPLRFEQLLPSTTPFSLLGAPVPCLSPEQLLLVLCMHGAKHAWERLEWVCSVAHLIARHPEIDWDRLAADARAVRTQRSVALGLALATRLAGAPVPASVMRTIGAHSVRPLAADIEAGLFQWPPSAERPLKRYSLRFRARSLEERVRYVLFLRLPTERDRDFLTLPGRLSFLYFLVRPVRIASQHVPRGERVRMRHADRVRARQLLHQRQKASRLQGRDDEMGAALVARWDRVQRRLARLKPDLEDPRILEVGSGAHGIVFGTRSSRAAGVDPLAAEYANLFPAWQRNVPTVAADGQRLPFADGAFDVVFCDNVVDHAERPAAIVGEMVRVLAPGGLLYFTVNVHHRLYSIVSRAHRAWTTAGVPLEIGPFADHTFHFTPTEARALFTGLPLEIRREHFDKDVAKARARQRRIRHPGHLLAFVFFKNARLTVLAERR
jgi:SAM-dependent methyltransferase